MSKKETTKQLQTFEERLLSLRLKDSQEKGYLLGSKNEKEKKNRRVELVS